MNVAWVTAKHGSGVREQSRVVSEELDVTLVSADPINIQHEDAYIVDENDVVHPIQSLQDTLMEIGFDIAVFHSFNPNARSALRKVHPYMISVVRLGVNFQAELLAGKGGHLVDILEVIRLADHVVASGTHPNSQLESIGFNRKSVIPSAISLDGALAPKENPPRTIGTLARIDKMKNQFFTVQVANGVRKFDYENVPDVILGGQQGDETLTVIDESVDHTGYHGSVDYVGYVEDPMENFWPYVGIHVLPSYTENCPQTVLEAAKMGVPTIAPNSAWATDFDKLMQAPLDRPTKWSSYVHELFENDEQRIRITEMQQQTLKERSATRICQQYRALFESLLDELIESKIPPGVTA